MTPPNRRARGTRPVLLAGFGGLLLLMAAAGFDGLRLLRYIQTRSDAVRNDFIERNRVLNQMRSDLYLSGTFVRDYILEPNPSRADSDRDRLNRTRRDISTDVEAYSRIQSSAEAENVSALHRELDEYWHLLEPAMQWDSEMRRRAGYVFLRDQVYPRRTALVATTDQIAAVNEHRLNERILQVTELFAGLRIRVGLTVAITLALGGLLAAFTTRRILGYEDAAARHLAELD